MDVKLVKEFYLSSRLKEEEEDRHLPHHQWEDYPHHLHHPLLEASRYFTHLFLPFSRIKRRIY